MGWRVKYLTRRWHLFCGLHTQITFSLATSRNALRLVLHSCSLHSFYKAVFKSITLRKDLFQFFILCVWAMCTCFHFVVTQWTKVVASLRARWPRLISFCRRRSKETFVAVGFALVVAAMTMRISKMTFIVIVFDWTVFGLLYAAESLLCWLW